jgi:hypothetical protein
VGTRCEIPELGLGSGINNFRTVARRFMMFVHSKTKKEDSARRTFVLIVGMHANHQRRIMVEGDLAREQKS